MHKAMFLFLFCFFFSIAKNCIYRSDFISLKEYTNCANNIIIIDTLSAQSYYPYICRTKLNNANHYIAIIGPRIGFFFFFGVFENHFCPEMCPDIQWILGIFIGFSSLLKVPSHCAIPIWKPNPTAKFWNQIILLFISFASIVYCFRFFFLSVSAALVALLC